METSERRKLISETAGAGKIPPQNVEVEEIILGQMLQFRDSIPVVISLITPETFYKESHRVIYAAILLLYDNGTEIDILTVTDQLRSDGNLDLAGGAYGVTILTDRVSSWANIEAHCRIIQEAFMKRVIISGVSESVSKAYEDQSDAFECLDVLEGSVNQINEIITSGGNLRPMASIASEVEKNAREREEKFKSGKCTGVPTGLKKLDKLTTGWQNGDLIILAGRPSMGKTALMIHHAISAGRPVCIYSLEMNSVSLADRMILSVSNVNPDKYRAGAMSAQDWDEFFRAKDIISSLPIYIDDNPAVTTRYIRSHSKLMKDKGMCEAIFIDYLQLVDMRSDLHGRNREQEVSATSRELKIIAKTLNVPVIVLSQLSRECEKRNDKRPLLSDLRESGAIEQDADVVVFAYRPAYYGTMFDEDGNSLQGVGFEIVAKGRNIGIGEIPFRHNESMTKIYDHVPEADLQQPDDDMPF